MDDAAELEHELCVLPPGPRCARCGHVVCPCCLDWCDMLIWPEPPDELGGDMCCDGECELDQVEVQRWVKSWPVDAYFLYRPVALVVAEGPWQ